MNSFETTISETQHRFEEFFKSEFEKLKQAAKQEAEHHQAKQIPEDAIIFELEGNKCKLASSSISFLKSPLNEDFDGILPPAEGWDRNGEQLALLTQYLIQGTWNTASVSSILGASLTKKIESRGFTIQIKTPPISEEKRSKIKEKISVFERGAKNPSRPPPAQVPPPGKTKRRGSQYENVVPTSPQLTSTDEESSSKEREPIVEEKQEERKTDQKEKEDKEREKREREEKEKKESQVEKKVESESVTHAKSNETPEKHEMNGELKHNEKDKQKEREREENLRKEKEERERKEKEERERKEKEERERKEKEERERKEKEERERKEREEKEKKEREEKERKEKEEREKKEMEEKQKKEKEKKPEKAEPETKKKKDKKSKKEEKKEDKKENSKPSEKKPEEKSKTPSSKVKVNVGACTEQGTRPYNEDTFTVIESLRADPTTSFFGVFDGHGGLNASTLCSKKMHENIVSQSCYKTDKKKAIIDGFIQTDRDYREKFPEGEDGSTAVIALLTEDYKLYVGHVGDSRILISQNGVARPLTKDHKVNNQTEISRIEKAGHHVEADIEYVDETNEYVETYRVDGELAVSRAIGDLNYKDYEGGPEEQAVTCIPEVSELTVNKGDFLVLACDGLWDVVEHQNVADYIHDRRKRGKSMQVISEQLVKDAIEIGSQDNVTVIIVEII